MLLNFAFIKLPFWRLLLPRFPASCPVQSTARVADVANAVPQGEDTELLRWDLRFLPTQPVLGFYDEQALIEHFVFPAEDTLQAVPLSLADDDLISSLMKVQRPGSKRGSH